MAVLKDVETYGLSAVGCQFHQIEGKLWEIKIKAPTSGYRIFYVMISSSELMCLHAYRKQGQKAPKKELEVAKKAKVSQPMIARLESGDSRRTPTIDTVHRILMILGYQLVLEVKPSGAA